MERAPLAGRRIVTTRDEPGRLDAELRALGADVVHVPLIEIVDPHDPRELSDALAALDGAAWLVVTSKHGARRVGATIADHPGVRLAVVGTATARELSAFAGREVDLVPDRQTAADLLEAFPPARDGDRVVLAVADRAEPTLGAGLHELGYAVIAATAYSTRLLTPTPAQREAALSADAVTFASGSAVHAWADAIGRPTPQVAVAIGPTTAKAASDRGVQITHIAADHSVTGLVDEVTVALRASE